MYLDYQISEVQISKACTDALNQVLKQYYQNIKIFRTNEQNVSLALRPLLIAKMGALRIYFTKLEQEQKNNNSSENKTFPSNLTTPSSLVEQEFQAEKSKEFEIDVLLEVIYIYIYRYYYY